jgi:hypothetical protein
MRGPSAAWARKAARPTPLGQGFFTLGFRPIELLELGNGQPSLKLDGVASYGINDICVPLYGLAKPAAESTA